MKDLARARYGSGIPYWRMGLLALVATLGIITLLRQSVNNAPNPKPQPRHANLQEAPANVEQFDIEFIENNLLTLDQTDPQLLWYTRIKYLTPPSKLPYSFKDDTGDHKDEFSEWIANFFNNKTNGRFIEAGANEGERGSHTLYLEKSLGWDGLLIECNPKLIPSLKTHHRKAWIADVCLSASSTPEVLNFSNPTNWSYSGTFRKPWKIPKKTDWEFFEVQTIPLFSVLAALDWTEVDYFSFDIEGVELSVLRVFPFNSFIFKVLIIEVFFYSKEERNELHDLLTANHYIRVKTKAHDWYYVHDSVENLDSRPV